MRAWLRQVTALGFWGCVVMTFGLHGCANRLGPVYATQNAGGLDSPNLPDVFIENDKECMESYGHQLDRGRLDLNATVPVHEDGDKLTVSLSGIPERAADFGACVRNALREMPIAEEPFRQAVAMLKYRREHVISEDSVVNVPGVLIVSDVPIVKGELVLEVDDHMVVLAVTVKVVDKEVKPIDLDKQTLARLGRVALAALGYDEIIQRAEKLGWIKTVPIEQALSVSGRLYMGDAVAVDAARDRAAKLFTRYAIAAGIASQADSPVPGPGDVIALGLLVSGMLHAGGVMVDEIIAAEHAEATASATPAPAAPAPAPAPAPTPAASATPPTPAASAAPRPPPQTTQTTKHKDANGRVIKTVTKTGDNVTTTVPKNAPPQAPAVVKGKPPGTAAQPAVKEAKPGTNSTKRPGNQGHDDHKADVKGGGREQAESLKRPGETVKTEKPIEGRPGVNRRPDNQIVGKDGKTRVAVESERRPNGPYHQKRVKELEDAGIEVITRPPAAWKK